MTNRIAPILQRAIGLLTAVAVLVNSVFAAPAFCGGEGCAAMTAQEDAADSPAPKSCCGAKCCGCCRCCVAQDEDTPAEPAACRCGQSSEAPAVPAPTEPSQSRYRDLANTGFELVDGADAQLAELSPALVAAESAAVPMLSGGVQVHFCIWLT